MTRDDVRTWSHRHPSRSCNCGSLSLANHHCSLFLLDSLANPIHKTHLQHSFFLNKAQKAYAVCLFLMYVLIFSLNFTSEVQKCTFKMTAYITILAINSRTGDFQECQVLRDVGVNCQNWQCCVSHVTDLGLYCSFQQLVLEGVAKPNRTTSRHRSWTSVVAAVWLKAQWE